MKLKLQLRCKQSEFRLSNCLIDKVIVLPQSEFSDLMEHPLSGRDWITENRGLMHCSEKDMHCLLALGEDSVDGLVIEAEGYDYARYAAYLPGAGTLVLNEVRQAADFIVRNGVTNSTTGSMVTTFSQLEESLGLKVNPGNGFDEMILRELNLREEVWDAELHEGGFNTTFDTDFCLNLEDHAESAQEQGQQM